MMKRIWITVLCGLLAAGCYADGESAEKTPDTGKITQCKPGEEKSCSCTDGRNGSQNCKSDGSGFNACTCIGPIPDGGNDDECTKNSDCESDEVCDDGECVTPTPDAGIDAGGNTGGSDGSGGSGSGGTSSSGGSGGGNACIPGKTVSCACQDGSTGAQTCKKDGKSFGTCACFEPPSGSGGASGAGGTSSGSGGGSNASGGSPGAGGHQPQGSGGSPPVTDDWVDVMIRYTLPKGAPEPDQVLVKGWMDGFSVLYGDLCNSNNQPGEDRFVRNGNMYTCTRRLPPTWVDGSFNVEVDVGDENINLVPTRTAIAWFCYERLGNDRPAGCDSACYALYGALEIGEVSQTISCSHWNGLNGGGCNVTPSQCQ